MSGDVMGALRFSAEWREGNESVYMYRISNLELERLRGESNLDARATRYLMERDIRKRLWKRLKPKSGKTFSRWKHLRRRR